MASKDKPMVKPTYQSIREKVGSIPTRMATRFAEEAKKNFINLAKDDAKKAMEKGKAALNNSMMNDLKKVQANESSRLQGYNTLLKAEEASKKKN